VVTPGGSGSVCAPRLRRVRVDPLGSPRVHAAGASPSPYVPALSRRETPAPPRPECLLSKLPPPPRPECLLSRAGGDQALCLRSAAASARPECLLSRAGGDQALCLRSAAASARPECLLSRAGGDQTLCLRSAAASAGLNAVPLGRPQGSPRVHAAGASPSTYVPAPRRREAPAFTRREYHLPPTSPRRAAEKPPRSRGGSLTFHLRPRAAPPRSPRVHAAGASPSTYVPAPRCREAPAFTRREPHLHPTSRRCPAEKRPRPPRPECLLSRPPRPECLFPRIAVERAPRRWLRSPCDCQLATDVIKFSTKLRDRRRPTP